MKVDIATECKKVGVDGWKVATAAKKAGADDKSYRDSVVTRALARAGTDYERPGHTGRVVEAVADVMNEDKLARKQASRDYWKDWEK